MYLRQSTSQVIRFGPFLDSTDGVTPETGLTITQADMQLSKDGGAFAQKNASGNAVHDTDGWYSTTLNTTDTATTGIIELQINVTGALPVWKTFFVLTQSAYDALQTGTFNNLGGTAQSVDNDVKISLIPTTPMRGTDGANTTAPDNAGITANGVAIAALNDISVSDILTTQMVESYSADGVAPTLAQSLFLTMQNLQDYSYAGTTQTVNKIDGAAIAATYTLDDAVNPTSKTRAT